MTPLPDHDLQEHCAAMAQRARRASTQLAVLGGAVKNTWLRTSAEQLRAQTDVILAANADDLTAAPKYGLTPAQVDRLRLDDSRIDAIAHGLEEIAMLPDPIGATIGATVRPNGLDIARVRVPLGVVFFIYESRPNVTADAAAICAKSGNAVILRGGKEAHHSSAAIVDVLRRVGNDVGMPDNAVQLVDTADRAAVGHFLALANLIDVAIPRGGEGLIRRVSKEATMPVIKHFDGNCHIYIDRSADPAMAVPIVVNSKCQRMGVCNACESLVVHTEAKAVLAEIARALVQQKVELRGDAEACQLIPEAKPATEDDFRREFLGPVISIRIVATIDAAIEHINHYGSHHTDAIITTALAAANRFAASVDSAAVMINASTRFHDGGQFGLGAEIGISTDKFHARGPCGLTELTSYKYIVRGDGQTRS